MQRGARFRGGGTAKAPSLPADDLFTNDGKGIYFVEEGLESALNPKPRTRHRAKKLDGEAEAFLVATACSVAPDGRNDWTLQLLADRLVECRIVDSISAEAVRQVLKKTRSNPG